MEGEPIKDEELLRKGQEAKKALLNETFRLGYEVGYFNHVEWFGWVAKEKDKLLKNATQFALVNEALSHYKQGYQAGHKKRLNDLYNIVKKKVSNKERGLDSILGSVSAERKVVPTPSLALGLQPTNIRAIEKMLPIVHHVLKRNIGKLETEIKHNNEFIHTQEKNIGMMDEGIAICNQLIKERKKEINVLGKHISEAKKALSMLEDLKGKLKDLGIKPQGPEQEQAKPEIPKQETYKSSEDPERLSYIQ